MYHISSNLITPRWITSVCVSLLKSGRLWALWSWEASCSCCWWGSAGASVVLTPAAATSAAAAVLKHAAVHDTVSSNTKHRSQSAQHLLCTEGSLFRCFAQYMRQGEKRTVYRPLSLLRIHTTFLVYLLWFLLHLHPSWTQRWSLSPQWRTTCMEVSVSDD